MTSGAQHQLELTQSPPGYYRQFRATPAENLNPAPPVARPVSDMDLVTPMGTELLTIPGSSLPALNPGQIPAYGGGQDLPDPQAAPPHPHVSEPPPYAAPLHPHLCAPQLQTMNMETIQPHIDGPACAGAQPAPLPPQKPPGLLDKCLCAMRCCNTLAEFYGLIDGCCSGDCSEF